MGHHHTHHHPSTTLADSHTAWLMKLATQFAVFVATCLFIAKLVAWFHTNSVSLLSAVVDSFFDITTSLINLFAVLYALKPADDDHRFGHGKAEAVASFSQALIIGASGLYIVFESVMRLYRPEPLRDEGLGIGVMAFSMFATFLLVLFQTYVIRRTGSLVVRSDSLHYVTDLLTNFAVIISLVASSHLGTPVVDVMLGLVIAGYVLYGAGKIGYEAFHHLMDRELPDAERERIIALARMHPQVKGVNHLRTRQSGAQLFVQFEVELDGTLPLALAHEITHTIERAIVDVFSNAEVMIHQEVAKPEALALPRKGA